MTRNLLKQSIRFLIASFVAPVGMTLLIKIRVKPKIIEILKKIIYQLSILILCLACNSTKSISDKEKEIINEVNSPKIAFLTYEITTNEEVIDLINTNKTFVKGKLKQKNKAVFNDGDLKFTLLNKDKTKISVFYLGNPLTKVVEYIDENKEFKKKEIKLVKNDFFIRFQWEDNVEFVQVEKVFLTKNPIHLLTTKLLK